MAKSSDFEKKNKLSNGVKGYLISRAVVQGCTILGDRGAPLPPKSSPKVLISRLLHIRSSNTTYYMPIIMYVRHTNFENLEAMI